MQRVCLVFVFLFFFPVPGISADVVFSAIDVDDQTSNGSIVGLDHDGLVLLVDGKETTIPLSRLALLQSGNSDPFAKGNSAVLFADQTFQNPDRRENNENWENGKTPFPDSVLVVDLVDGSRLVVTSLTGKGKTASCRLVGGVEWTLPFDLLDSIRFNVKTRDEAALPPDNWRNLVLGKGRKGDRLIVGSVESLDGYDGVVSEITADTLSFSVDGETLPIPRRRVHGVLFHKPTVETPETRPLVLGRLTLWTGSQILIQSFHFSKEDRRIHWASLSGLKGSSALDEIDQMVFGRSEVVYLSDMVPERVDQALLFEWEKKSSDADSPLDMLRTYRTNRMSHGKQVEQQASTLTDAMASWSRSGNRAGRKTMNHPIPDLHDIIMDGVPYERGLTVPVGTTLLYSLQESFTALRGIAGIDDRIRPSGHVRLIVQADETLLVDKIIRGDRGADPLKWELPKNARTLKITVDYPNAFSADSVPLSLAEIRLLK